MKVSFSITKKFYHPRINNSNGCWNKCSLFRIKLVESGAKEQLFIKFDKNNQPCDLGVSWEAEIDIKGVGNPEIKTGYTVGINSGWNFELAH